MQLEEIGITGDEVMCAPSDRSLQDLVVIGILTYMHATGGRGPFRNGSEIKEGGRI